MKRLPSIPLSFRFYPFLMGCLCIFACCLLWWSFGYNKPLFFSSIDARIVDTMFRFRGPEKTTGQVVIVDIDEKSLKEYGQWPWPRNLLAKLTEKISSAGAKVIGFDILFAEEDRTSPSRILDTYSNLLDQNSCFENVLGQIKADPQYNYDTLFGNAISDSGSVLGYVFLFRDDKLKEDTAAPFPTGTFTLDQEDVTFGDVSFISAYRSVVNIEELSYGGSEGFINVFPDPGGTVRRFPLLIEMDGIPYPALPFEMVRLAENISDIEIRLSRIATTSKASILGLSLGNRFIRTDNYGQLTINFRGGYKTFPYLSAVDIMQSDRAEELKDKYVLIGASAAGLMDIVSTPFSSNLPGVEVHANIIDNLINNDALYWENLTEIGLTYSVIIIAGTLISLLLSLLSPLPGMLATLSILTAFVAGNYYYLFQHQLLLGISFISLSLLAVILSVTFANFFFEGRKRLLIRRVFSHYVSPSVVNELLQSPDKLNLLVEEREVTILFCDIRNFTRLSEMTPASELGPFLNDYFTLLTNIIIQNNGMVDKFIGDAVMAVWGTPMDDPDHSDNAVRAALEMLAFFDSDQKGKHSKRYQLSGHPIQIGIGINSGLVSTGNFGSDNRFDYTVLGDNVNLASRIESLTKYYKVPLLVSEETKVLVGRSFNFFYIDTVQVKGRSRPVALYLPFSGDRDHLFANKIEETYEKALLQYKKGDFGSAQPLFAKIFKATGFRTFEIYEMRCATFVETAPPDGWDGVYSFNL